MYPPYFSAADLCSALSERYQTLYRETEKLRPAIGQKPSQKFRKLCAESNRAYEAVMAAHAMYEQMREKAGVPI